MDFALVRKTLAGLAARLAVCLWVASTQEKEDKIDLAVLHRIKSEPFGGNLKVLDTVFYLTDVYGPRLTGSPSIKAAGEWTVKKMNEWGLAKAKMGARGPFGRGWVSTRFAAMMKEPEFSP
jgi:carboxypeptidase Q